MNSALSEPRPWPRRRWWFLIALVFAAHLGLIFTLADRSPVVPRQPAGVPALKLVTDGSELLALNDPTLFALPHPRGFAGAAWLQVPSPPFRPFKWTEPPRWLALPLEQLGAVFARFMETNRFAPFQLELNPSPDLTVPELAPEPAVAAQSALRLEGDLAQRRLLNPIDLTNQPSSDRLTNSIVQVLVDAMGNVFSPVLLPPGSGSKEADQGALDLAKIARFEPLARGGASEPANPAADLSGGLMIFEWHTVPPAETNTPATVP
jgi:hypothetical protein